MSIPNIKKCRLPNDKQHPAKCILSLSCDTKFKQITLTKKIFL